MTEQTSEPDTATLILADKLDTNAAPALWSDAVALPDGTVTIDATTVEHLGAQCLQVLLLLVRDRASQGAKVDLKDPSEEFESAVVDLGFSLSDLKNEEAA